MLSSLYVCGTKVETTSEKNDYNTSFNEVWNLVKAVKIL